MESFAESVLKEVPPELKMLVDIHSSDKVAIFRIKHVYSQEKGYKNYKILITASQSPPLKIEKRKCIIQPNKLFPINPNQTHAYTVDAVVPQYYAIFIEKNFLQEISYALFGKREIYFVNGNYDLNDRLRILIELFIKEEKNKEPGYQFMLQGLSNEIAVSVLRSVKGKFLSIKEENDNKQGVDRAIKFLLENYRNDFSLKELSKLVNYSNYHFIRMFKTETGKTPYEYLLDIKIEKSKEMLKNSNKSITEICNFCGFNNASNFSVVFKKRVGVSPSHFRKVNRYTTEGLHQNH